MSVFSLVLNWIRTKFDNKKQIANIEEIAKEKTIEEIHSIWDHIRFVEQSQAHHICSILGFEEWVDMEEILRRIKEIFRVEYKNDRSLYPYIKTLVDCGLMEATAFGGKRKWRKKEVLIKITRKETQEEKRKDEKQIQTQKITNIHK